MGAGRASQVVADTVGSIAAVEALFPAMRRYSHLVSAGFYGHDGQIDIQKLRDREMTLHAPAGWTSERMDATLDLLAAGRAADAAPHHAPLPGDAGGRSVRPDPRRGAERRARASCWTGTQ